MEIEYKCKKCKHNTIYWKSYKKEIPIHVKCNHCNSYNTKRIYSTIHISIPAGNCGNAKNGYTSKKLGGK